MTSQQLCCANWNSPIENERKTNYFLFPFYILSKIKFGPFYKMSFHSSLADPCPIPW